MNQTLYNLYNALKKQFIEAIESCLKEKAVDDKVSFQSLLRVSMPRDSWYCFEDIVGVKYNKQEKAWYIHAYYTDEDFVATEQWIPLYDTPIEELLEIAKAL